MRIFVFLLIALTVAQSTLRAQAPVIVSQPGSRTVWSGGNVTFTVGVSNAGEYTYQWRFNANNLTNGLISTVAGNGTGTYAGDSDAATNASVWNPSGVAVDGSGNLFIADVNNSRVRKVNTSGIITTVAGNGSSTYSGDGGPATNAGMNAWGVAVDNSGNLFIADHSNNRIRKVDTNGIITTVAGDAGRGYSGDGVQATSTALDFPPDVVVDSVGNLFIADLDNHRVRKVNTNGIITTVAGNGSLANTGDGGPATNASLCYPAGVALDGLGKLFIADFYTNHVRVVNTSGVITNLAGIGPAGFSGDGGPATNAELNGCTGVAVDNSGNVYIADANNQRIRKVGANGLITTFAGHTNVAGYAGDGGLATNASLNYPGAVAVDGFGNLFIADTDNNRIRKVINTQGPTLALNEVTAANSGNYQVVVTGPGGSVTSSVATLTVASAPLIYAAAPNAGGGVTLSMVSLPGSTNIVFSATNLTPPIQWQPLFTNLAGPDGDGQFIDPSPATNPAKFYRFHAP